MERPTLELLLPQSKAKVVLYKYLSNGQFNDIQKSLLSNVKINMSDLSDDDAKNAEVLKKSMNDIPANLAFNQGELLQKFIIKEIYNEDGTIVLTESIVQFVYDLPISDGQLLQAELTRIEKESNLSAQAKKK